jgi:hypothetical protein
MRVYKFQFLTQEQALTVPIIKISVPILLKEIIDVYFKNHTKHMILCVIKVWRLDVTVCGKYNLITMGPRY